MQLLMQMSSVKMSLQYVAAFGKVTNIIGGMREQRRSIRLGTRCPLPTEGHLHLEVPLSMEMGFTGPI